MNSEDRIQNELDQARFEIEYKKVNQEGRNAFFNEDSVNPHRVTSSEWPMWNDGFREAAESVDAYDEGRVSYREY